MFYKVWEMVGLVILVYQILFIPFRFFLNFPAVGWQFWMEVLMDIFFWLDLFLNFNLGYFDQNKVLILERRKIAIQYLKGWFTLDMIANLPLNYISEQIEEINT
jgi:hypothetical protein